MGLDYHSAKWILGATKWSDCRVLTVGRQNWWLSRREAIKLGSGYAPEYGPQQYSDDFWRIIGCRVESVDLVADESPDHLVDLSITGSIRNAGLAGLFDRVVDLGTAEHVFDQKAYWMNLHDALSVCGELIGILPADGMCGHGLYQFSPETFLRMGGFYASKIGWLVYGPTVRFVEFQDGARHQRKFRWPSYVAFVIRKDSGFRDPIQFMNATTPTTKPTNAKLAGALLNIPGVRAVERIVRGF